MRCDAAWFRRDVRAVAPELVGKLLCHRLSTGEVLKVRISETEAYCGEGDTACHASKTPRREGRLYRSDMLYEAGGRLYIYLCYGMHSLTNITTGAEGDPQAVLLRAGVGAKGPGLLSRACALTREQNGLALGDEVWIEDDGARPTVTTAPRVGIDYASERDRAAPLRFIGHFEEEKK